MKFVKGDVIALLLVGASGDVASLLNRSEPDPASADPKNALKRRMAQPSRFAALGGEAQLRPIIDRFVDRMFDDIMIGYLFRAADRTRVKAKEYEFAARHLGAPVEYTGRAVDEAHRAHRITGGQFMRRLQILKETLAQFQVAPEIVEHWLAHTLSLQSDVTKNALDDCDPAAPQRSRSVPE